MFSLAFGLAQASFHLRALVDFPTQLGVEVSQLSGALTHPLLQMLIGLMQRFGGAPQFGDVTNQHKDAQHFTAGLTVRYIGAQHVALLTVVVGFRHLKGHALARQSPVNIGL